LQAVRWVFTDFNLERMENIMIAEMTRATPKAINIEVNI